MGKIPKLCSKCWKNGKKEAAKYYVYPCPQSNEFAGKGLCEKHKHVTGNMLIPMDIYFGDDIEKTKKYLERHVILHTTRNTIALQVFAKDIPLYKDKDEQFIKEDINKRLSEGAKDAGFTENEWKTMIAKEPSWYEDFCEYTLKIFMKQRINQPEPPSISLLETWQESLFKKNNAGDPNEQVNNK